MPHDHTVTVDHFPLGGRVRTLTHADPVYRVFGAIALNPGDLPGTLYSQRTPVQGAGKTKGCRDSEFRMRRIRSSGIEVVRSAPQNPEGPLPINDVVPPEDGSNRSPSFSMLIDASTPEGLTTFRMDIGETLDMLCSTVNITLCGPDAQLVGATPIDPRLGLLTDARVGVAVSAIESVDGGHRRVTFSELVRIPANAPLYIPVPSYARECKVFMTQGSVVGAPPWQGFVDNIGFAEACLIDFDPTGTYSLNETRELAGASFLRTDSNPADRVASLVWQIEP